MVYRIMKFMLLVLLLACRGWAALPANTIWELRTAGNFNNGGCFVETGTGTDYSQQNAAQYTAADLVLVTTTTASSASHSFIASDVGNCLHITAGSGFTQGFYEIVSVAAGEATFDRAAGTMGSTGGTYAVGGAIILPATLMSNWTAGNTAWMKDDGTYTVTATANIGGLQSINTSGLSITNSVIGYTTTRGDCDRPTWTSATNSINLVTSASGGGSNDVGSMLFACINMTHTAGTRGNGFQLTQANQSFANLVLQNMSFDGMASAVNVAASNTPIQVSLYNVEVQNSTGDGLTSSNNSIPFYNIYYSWIHDNTGNGVLNIGTGSLVASVFSDNGGDGVQFGWNSAGVNNFQLVTVNRCVFYNNGSDGIQTATSNGTLSMQASNNVFWDNTGQAINWSGTPPPGGPVSYSNAYATGELTNWPAGTGDVTISADPFTNAAAGDYSLNNTAGGGALLKQAGFPGVALFGTGYLDIGAVQSQGSGGSATQTVFGVVN